MDKNTYETYEFLPVNNMEANADQFFVVQDDGTFLINRQMQYVAQVQDVKEVLEDVQPCSVYDVSSQQFYVDVDSTTELIPVPDQFILPTGDNNLYGNTYLLQPGTSTNEEQMADVMKQEKEEPFMQDTQSSSINNSCTEITLSDEQYKMLEAKGWVLLKSNDKVFVLNTMGLHDITTNEKLISKLKNEIQGNDTEIDSGCLTTTQEHETESPYSDTNKSNQEETMEKVCGDIIGTSMEKSEILPLTKTDNTQSHCLENLIEDTQGLNESKEDHQALECDMVPEPIEVTTYTNEQNNSTSVKIKTKFSFKDIPDKIFLGTTVQGKKLVAKVVKSGANKRIMKRNHHYDKNNCLFNMGLDETQFLNLIQLAVKGAIVKSSAEDLAAAESVIAHILRVQNLKQRVVGHSLVITKVIINQDETGKVTRRTQPTFVSGIIAPAENTDGRFVHIPNLLQRLKDMTGKQSSGHNGTVSKALNPGKVGIYHINVWELRSVNSPTKVSVTLNRRQLSLDLISDLNKRHPNTVYACGTCAAIFKTKELLENHQENQCFVGDDMLTMDMDKPNNATNLYTVTKHGNKNMYTCTQCKAKFTRLNNCQNHLKTHSNNSKTLDNNVMKAESTEQRVYKCKMCPSSYNHPSTLSKHIAKHIMGEYK